MPGRGKTARRPHEHGPRDQQRRRSNRQELQHGAIEHGAQFAAPERAYDDKTGPKQRDREHRSEAALQEPLGDERAPNERDRRTDQLHDFNFVTAATPSPPHHPAPPSRPRPRHPQPHRRTPPPHSRPTPRHSRPPHPRPSPLGRPPPRS